MILYLTPFILKGSNGPLLDVGQTFHSTLESTYYQALLNDEAPDFLSALMVAGGAEIGEEDLDRAEAFLHEVLQEIQEQKILANSLEARVEGISELLHGRFLHRYEKIVGFHKLVDEGIYNCVSATALYGLVLAELKIPFELVEQKDHVYLVVGEKERIIVEPTSSTGEVLRPGRRMRRKWLTWLRQEGMVSPGELRGEGRKSTFEKHFFTDPQISFQQLCGIQYLNQGILALEGEDHSGALAALEKAYPLYPRAEVTRLRLYAAYFNAVTQHSGTRGDLQAQIRLLVAAQDPNLKQELEDGAFHHFGDYLTLHHSPAHWAALESALNGTVVSHGFRSRIKHFYHLAAGESAADRSDFDLLWEHASKAINLMPNDSLTQIFVVESALAGLPQAAAPTWVLGELERFEEIYPFFKETEQAIDIKAQTYLLLATAAFDQNDSASADAHLEEYEGLRPELWEGQEEKLGLAYSAKVRYHFRTGNLEAARLALKQGLDLAPFNRDLKRTHEIFAGELDF